MKSRHIVETLAQKVKSSSLREITTDFFIHYGQRDESRALDSAEGF